MGCDFEMFGRNAIPCRAATRVLSHVRAAAEETQHDRIWKIYLKFVSQEGVPIETSLRVYRWFLKYDPTHVEDFIEFLQSSELWQEAAERLAQVLNNENFFSRKGKTRHQLWLSLCQLLTTHTREVFGLQVDAIIRGEIRRFTNEVGRLWTSLTDYYIRCGLFEKARDIFEEGVMSVVTVRDFSIVFDAYSQFEESILAAKMEQSSLENDDGQVVEEEEAELDPHRPTTFEEWIKKPFRLNEENDVDLRLARLENLMERRHELVSSVLLRQNPHNVHEWHKRGNPTKQVLTHTEAVRTVCYVHFLLVRLIRYFKTLLTCNSFHSFYGEEMPVGELSYCIAHYAHLNTLYWWLRFLQSS